MENCVAENLKYLRATNGISIKALAEMVVIDPRFVEALEKVDSNDLHNLKSMEEDERLSKLCNYFNVSLGHLLFENIEENEDKKLKKALVVKTIDPLKNVFKKTSALKQMVADLQEQCNIYMNKAKMIRNQ